MLAEQKTTAFRHGMVAAILKHYEPRFKNIKASRACEILRRVGSGDDTFYVISFPENTEIQWTPNRMLKYECHFKSRYAKSVFPITFVGGPPDKWGTYSGSLLTFLLDRIAVVVLFEGMSALDGVIEPGERYSDYA